MAHQTRSRFPESAASTLLSRSRYVCPTCPPDSNARPTKANAKDGRCSNCRTNSNLYPINFAGRKRKRRLNIQADAEPNYAQV
jgi:hypothetical protein